MNTKTKLMYFDIDRHQNMQVLHMPAYSDDDALAKYINLGFVFILQYIP